MYLYTFKTGKKEMRIFKRIISLLIALTLVFEPVAVSDGGASHVYAAEEDTVADAASVDSSDVYDSDLVVEKVDNLDEDFIMGVDVSSVIALENAGVTYYDFDGNESDLFEVLAEAGVNYIRVRIWNDPYDSDGNGYGGGNNDLAVAEAIGKRATAAGLKLYVDFHYSDFWADPSKQTKPKAWTDYSTSEIVSAVEEFTTESLQQLYDAGIDIGMVQVGNETTTSFIGASSGTSAYYSYFVSGCDAVRAFSDKYDLDIKVAVHWTNPNSQNYTNVVKNLINNGVDFDVFASSYYPAWHGTLSNVKSKLNAVKTTYGKDVMIAETAYPYQYETDTSLYTYGVSVQGQASYLRDLIAEMSDIGAIGVFYWEPAWINTTSSDWNKYGTGWTSSYASGYDSDATSAGACTTTNTALFKKTSTYKFYPLESLNVFKYVYKGTTAAIAITDYEIPTVEVGIGETFTLPETVTVTYGSGKTGDETVVWDDESINNVDTSKEAEYTVTGSISGFDDTVYCKIIVSDIYIVYAYEAETSVQLGGTVTYPDTVCVKRSNATTAYVDVTWNETEMSKVSTDVTGEYTVSGTVSGYSEPVYCKVSVYILGENIVQNSGFEDTGGATGNIRDIPNWTTVSSVGTSGTYPVYTEAKNAYEGDRKFSIWTDSYDNYNVEIYQEIDISQYGPGVYTVSLYASGNIDSDSLYVYLKDGDYDSEIVEWTYINQNSGQYVITTFSATITNGESVTIGIVGEGVAKSAWANIDCVEVVSPGSYEMSASEQLAKLAADAESYLNNGTAVSDGELTEAVDFAKEVINNADASDDEIAEALATLESALGNTEFSITVSDAENGRISCAVESAKPGDTVSLDILPDDTYELYSLKVVDDNLQEVTVDDDYSFVMPSSPVTVTAVFKLEDKYINQTTLYYYYSGTGKPALLFDSVIDGEEYDFTYGGKYGYYMEADAITGEYWYKSKIKELYGGFSIYVVSGSTYKLMSGYEYDSSKYRAFITESVVYLFRGTEYESYDSIEGLNQLDTPEVKVTNSTSVATVRIEWEAIAGATIYYVYRNGTYLKAVTATAATDTFYDVNKEYSYTVIAVDKNGVKENSDASEAVTVKSLDWPITTATRNGTTINVNWEEITGADGYIVQRSTNGSSYSTVKTVTGGSTVAYADTSKKISQAYYYRVIPYYSSGSVKVWGATNEIYVAAISFGAPKSVTVKRSSPTKIKITWKKATNASGYIIKRSTSKSSGYKTIKTVNGNTKSSYSYTDTGVKAGKTYYYRVLSYRTVGSAKVYSSYSTKTIKKVTVSSLSDKKVTVKKLSSKKVKISWKKVSNCTGYIIYRSTKKSSGYKKIKTITSKSKVSYTDKSVKKGKTYYYKIRTYKKVGTGKIYGKYTTAKKVKVK